MAFPRPLREPVREDAAASPTRERLLRAAERLVAEGGVEACSMRAVTHAAGVSVSAANYHFGSKQALVRETLWRVLAPLNERRLERLDALEASAADAPPSVDVLLDAFLRPGFELQSREAPGIYRRLAIELHGATPEIEARMKDELLNPAFRRFVDALVRALPGCRREDVALAFQLALGASLHLLHGHAERMADVVGLPDEELLDRLVRFAAGGIRACARRASAEPAS